MKKTVGTVLTIGTFDGVHRGHRAIIQKTCRLAQQNAAIPTAITFDIPPRLFFFSSKEPALLTAVSEKVFLLKKLGIEKMVLLRFNSKLAQISAENFFENFIVKKFHPCAIVVGYNFGFGRNREGDPRFLEMMGRKHSIFVEVVPPLCFGNIPISSGRIRELLREGNVERANRLLGEPYFAVGTVVSGQGFGRKIGFPTVNLSVPHEKIVPEGVFAVRVTMSDGRSSHDLRFSAHSHDGMCNVGFRPTVCSNDDMKERTVEVHLFHFSRNLCNSILKVEFLRKMRSERKFSSLEELKNQLKKDKKQVLSYFTRSKSI